VSELDKFFKFKIGDIVRMRLQQAEERYPRRVFILGRLLQECPGGIQKNYKIEGFDWKNGQCLWTVLEEQVEAIPEEEKKK